MSQSKRETSLLFLFVFLPMMSQDHSLVFFFYINETRTILCGSFKKIPNEPK
jgi:hypothetical protein